MTDPQRTKPARSSILAGIAYFALVFALGFLLGTLRTIMVRDAPADGRLIGVLIELPIMLWASWFLCRFVVRRFSVAPTFVARAVMGGLAFTLLQLAEVLLGALLLGRTPGEHIALYREASYALGLGVQIGFGLMPMIQMRQASSHRSRPIPGVPPSTRATVRPIARPTGSPVSGEHMRPI